jgi:uncharacterized protein DUF4153
MAAPARRVVIAGAVAIGAGAIALPGWRVGLGWPVVSLALVSVVLTARSARARVSTEDTRRPDGDADRAWRVAAAVAALALMVVPAVRAAGWLTVICLLTAAGLASYALAGGRSWVGVLRGTTALIPAAGRGLRSTATARPENQTGSVRIVGGVAIGAVLLVVFGALFRAADPAFAGLLDSWRSALSTVDLLRAALGVAVAGLLAVGSAHLVRHARAPSPPTAPADRTRLSVAEWATPVVMLDVLFAVFVWVQIAVLFAGNDYVLAPGGPNYAVHARGGSAQLGVVTVLTLGVVAALSVWARPATVAQTRLRRAIGGVLCGLTLVIVASALRRLALYAEAYGFTVPRLVVFAGVAWLGIVLILVMVAGARRRAGWLPRAVVASAVVVLLGLVAVNPEALMARTVLARLGGPFPVDQAYVRGLSADALDEIARVPDTRLRDCLLVPLAERLHAPDPWYAWNLARQRARAYLAEHPPQCL